MSEELTPLEPLEPLEELRNLAQMAYYYAEDNECLDNAKGHFQIIETALKRNIELEKANIKLMEENTRLRERPLDFYTDVEKKLKALNEILVLHDKWLGYEMSDFEFFTLFNEIKDKYDLFKEVLQ